MFNKNNLNVDDYLSSSFKLDKVNWWDLPNWINLQLKKSPKEIKKPRDFITIGKLKRIKQKNNITKNIIGIKKEMFGNNAFKISFPVLLNTKEYARLYALMTSEGSHKTEFSLHVPEKEFHSLFKECVKKLISEEAKSLIKSKYQKGVLRSRAPGIIRHLIPLPLRIPFIIINNKNLAREYLRVAFEAEGSPILNQKQHKRYIKLSRYVDITFFVSKENIPLYKRIYIGDIKEKYFSLFKKIKDYHPTLLLGEKILLKKHFDIDSKLQLEAIRKNKTDFRAGKITARWVLLIYANNIDKYIKEIGFISRNKNKKLEEMKKIKGNRPQYSTLDLIKKV